MFSEHHIYIIIYRKNNLDQDYVYLIKGDALLEEKNEKKGKKKTSSEKNILEQLEI